MLIAKFIRAIAVTTLLTGGILTASDAAGQVCDRELLMAHSSDYAPYQFKDSAGQLVGLDVDLAQAVMMRIGCRLRIEEIPPKRAQYMLAAGELDIMAAASITDERLQYAHFSDPYRDERIVMFVASSRLNSLKDLDLNKALDLELVMVAGLGGWYGQEYERFRDRARERGLLQLNNSTQSRIRQLVSRRVDLVIADLYVGYHHAIRMRAQDEIAELPHVLNSDPVHFMLSRKAVPQAWLATLNKALADLKASSLYPELIRRYRPVAVN